jgi:MFS family permease
MTNAYRVGWGSPIIMAGLGSAGMLLAIFIWWERRTPDPMLAMELFKHRLFSVGITAAFFSFMVGTSIYYLMPFYVQDVLGFSPLQAGLILTPVALSYGLSGPIAGRLSDLYGWRRFAIAGLVILLASLVIFVRLTTTTPVWVVIVGLVMQGVGMGTFYSPNASAVLSVVNRSSYGIATAFLNLVRNTATMTGLGLATTIFTAVMVSSGFEPSLDAVGSAEDGEGVKAAFTEGLRTVYMVGAGLTVIAIILTTIQGKAATAEDVASETDQQMPSRV